MALPHGRRDAATPFVIEIAEPAVAVAVGRARGDTPATTATASPRARHSSPWTWLQSGNGLPPGGASPAGANSLRSSPCRRDPPGSAK
jgi:hypothetical protein